jgi:hypothetical protein
MSYEEEFDKLMREKAEGLDFPFDESHWEKASKIITRHRSAGRTTAYKIAAGIVAVGGLITILVIVSPDAVRPESPKVASIEADNTRAVQPAVFSEAKTTENKKENNSLQPVNENPSANSVDAEYTKMTSGSAVVSMKVKSASPSAKSAAPNEASAAGAVGMSTTDDNDHTPPVENNKLISVPAPVVVQQNEPSAGEVNASQSAEVTGSENAVSANEQAETLVGKFVFLENNARQQEIIVQRVVPVKSPDYFKKSSKAIKFYLDAYAGGAYQNGWEKDGKTDGAGGSWYGGLSAGYFLNKKISVGSGLQAFNIGNISQPFYSVYSTSYDFTSVTTKTVINCTNMIYLAVPLQFSYHFANNNSFRLGVYASQLLFASTKVESSTILDNEEINKSTTTTNAIYDGMTQQLFVASAAYNMKVGKRVYVNAELVYGLNTIYSSAAYGGVAARPAALRLGVAYRMIER